jgi:hypothetical protein
VGVVAFGVGVWVGYLVGYRNMILARREARKAWAYADTEERVAHELHAQLDKMFDAGYDTGFSDAAGIDVGGEVER